MRTLRSRVEKLERKDNASDGPGLQVIVMPAGAQLPEDFAQTEGALGHGGSWQGCSLIVLGHERLGLPPPARTATASK
jgi:hypothetical protein